MLFICSSVIIIPSSVLQMCNNMWSFIRFHIFKFKFPLSNARCNLFTWYKSQCEWVFTYFPSCIILLNPVGYRFFLYWANIMGFESGTYLLRALKRAQHDYEWGVVFPNHLPKSLNGIINWCLSSYECSVTIISHKSLYYMMKLRDWVNRR
jgi:hypothetical protein